MMEHKIYAFDYTSFQKEFSKILNYALTKNYCVDLKKYINNNLSLLSEPWDGGEKLDKNWENLTENNDEHEYGDFVLTKYYNIEYNGGLLSDYSRINDKTKYQNLLIGNSFGPKSNVFDPGKMGSYFLSNCQLTNNLKRMRFEDFFHTKLTEEENLTFNQYLKFIEQTISSGKGLYITF